MSYSNVVTPEIWVIRHIPTGTLLPANPSGRSHTRVAVLGNNSSIWEKQMTPRLFISKLQAQQCLVRWLQGIHSHHWEDGFDVRSPTVKRVKEDMEIIRVELITPVIEDFIP